MALGEASHSKDVFDVLVHFWADFQAQNSIENDMIYNMLVFEHLCFDIVLSKSFRTSFKGL